MPFTGQVNFGIEFVVNDQFYGCNKVIKTEVVVGRVILQLPGGLNRCLQVLEIILNFQDQGNIKWPVRSERAGGELFQHHMVVQIGLFIDIADLQIFYPEPLQRGCLGDFSWIGIAR